MVIFHSYVSLSEGTNSPVVHHVLDSVDSHVTR